MIKKFPFLLVFQILVALTGFDYSQDGIVPLYYDNGKLKAELDYANNVLNGKSVWYYPNGNEMKEITYVGGKPDGKVIYFYPSGLVKAEFTVNNGIRDGITRFYYPNGALKEIRSYRMGRLTKSVKISYDAEYTAPISAYKGAKKILEQRKKKKNFLCNVELCPQPVGGIDAIIKKIDYPTKAKLYGLEGKVIVIAHINKKGEVENVEIIKDPGLGLGKAAVKAVKSTKFLPGENNGKIVNAWVSLTIPFKLRKGKRNKPTTQIATIPGGEDYDIKQLNKELKKKKTTPATFNGEIASTKKSQKQKPQKTAVTEEEDFKIISCNADVCPQPVGGLKTLIKNLIVPKNVYRLKLIGFVVVEADIDELGYVRDTHVIKKMGYGLDEAAEVAILDTHFNPGKLNGKNIRCKVKILIPYSYKNKKRSEEK